MSAVPAAAGGYFYPRHFVRFQRTLGNRADEVAELSAASSGDSLTVHDHIAFETFTGQTVAAFQARFSWLIHDGEVFLSPRAALAVVEQACRRNPAPVLDLVMAEEAVAREKSKRGCAAPTVPASAPRRCC